MIISFQLRGPVGSTRDVFFYYTMGWFSCAELDGFRGRVRDVPLNNIFHQFALGCGDWIEVVIA